MPVKEQDTAPFQEPPEKFTWCWIQTEKETFQNLKLKTDLSKGLQRVFGLFACLLDEVTGTFIVDSGPEAGW